MQIIPFEARHIPQLAALETECFSSPWTADGFAEELRNPQAHFLVAEQDSNAVGYIGVQEICGEAYITNIAVSAPCRRQGIASALLKAAADGAISRGCSFLTLEVRESNMQAIRLYERHGFQFVGIRKAFYRDPTEDARLYTLFFEEQNP